MQSAKQVKAQAFATSVDFVRLTSNEGQDGQTQDDPLHGKRWSLPRVGSDSGGWAACGKRLVSMDDLSSLLKDKSARRQQLVNTQARVQIRTVGQQTTAAPESQATH
jgi:hypothetical protein